ncbi:MAG: lytic murein transglycosylase, partial [Acidimicrobiales bacterium]|nr:lytic murein transglycosylase [Acidimicrobiales bacterium]
MAKEKGISDNTIKIALSDVRYLQKVIDYDRKQPEFFEKTAVYISKRANKAALKKAKKKLRNNYKIFEKVEKEFQVEKELLLALWSIETNFGKH